MSSFLEDSFRTMTQGELYNESVFSASRFLVNNLGTMRPEGINIM